jgi:hypothetical protein
MAMVEISETNFQLHVMDSTPEIDLRDAGLKAAFQLHVMDSLWMLYQQTQMLRTFNSM